MQATLRILILGTWYLLVGANTTAQEPPSPPPRGKVFNTTLGEFRVRLHTTTTTTNDGIIRRTKWQITTPAGRKLYSGTKVFDIAEHTGHVYLVNRLGLLEYQKLIDNKKDATEEEQESIFQEVYRVPRDYLLTARVSWGQRVYYTIHSLPPRLKGGMKKRAIFRGFVRCYDRSNRPRIQYLPYTELPSHSAAPVVAYSGDKEKLIITVKCKGKRIKIYFTPDEEFINPFEA